MSIQLLATKINIPPPRLKVVPRPHLIDRLNESLHNTPSVTLISAPVGYGKTTLVSEWVACCERPVAWLSLDEGDNDPARFLTYLIAALKTLVKNIEPGMANPHQVPELPPVKSILINLLNEIAEYSDHFTLVLDDYHVIDSKSVEDILNFLLEHLPTKMHLVIATREDPNLPLARLRARDQLTELRAADLRFTPFEAAEFLNKVMSLDLSADDVTALETKTEGWIAGLQLAALSTRGHDDFHEFIKAFAGDDRYIVDYLVEEVLQCQSESIRSFLLQTSILGRLSGPLCDAVTGQVESHVILEGLERGNLFISPLDDKRHWFRYHQLFADVLQKYLLEEQPSLVPTLHQRASYWYEHNDLEIEAFQHAVAADDIELAERLMEGKGMPLQYRGAMAPVLHWLGSLPKEVLNERSTLLVAYASALSMVGRFTNIEEMLNAAEAALQDPEQNDKTRDLIGHVATLRALLAVQHNHIETILDQTHRALEYLHPDNLATRATTTWMMGHAYHLQGNRTAAKQAYSDAISISQASGNIMITIAAATFLGQVLEVDNLLYLAAESYRLALQLAGDPPQPIASEAYLGLARITFQWNNPDSAQQYGLQSLQLAQQMENVSTTAACGLLFFRLDLAQGKLNNAAVNLEEAEQFIQQHNFSHLMPDVAASKVIMLVHQGDLAEAALQAKKHKLPISQARVFLAQGDPTAALALLKPLYRQADLKCWQDERLKIMILQAIAFHALGENEQGMQVLGEALTMAEPEGFIRIFVDEGQSMALLLKEFLNRGIAANYIQRLLAAFPIDEVEQVDSLLIQTQTSELDVPLTQRELEVIRLIAQGLSNREISERLFLALNTVKGHNQMIFSKLQVQRRTEAVVRARELGLL